MSLCIPKMPNLFLYLGPNGGPGAGSFIAMLELVVEYIIKCARKMQIEHISSMEVKYETFASMNCWMMLMYSCREEAFGAFSDHVDRYFESTIFTYKVS